MVNKDKRLTQAVINEFKRLLKRLYRMEHDTGIRQELERSYLNGFAYAALYLKLTNNEDLADLMTKEEARLNAISQPNPRKRNLPLAEPERDFSEYDKPAWERKGD